MDTRKYDTSTRKALKREQRGPAYQLLQAKADREALEAKLAQREKPLREQMVELKRQMGETAEAIKAWMKEFENWVDGQACTDELKNACDNLIRSRLALDNSTRVAASLNSLLAKGCKVVAFDVVGSDLVVIASEPKG